MLVFSLLCLSLNGVLIVIVAIIIIKMRVFAAVAAAVGMTFNKLLLLAVGVTSILRVSVPGPRGTGKRILLSARLVNNFSTLSGRRRESELRTFSGSSRQIGG